MRWLCVFIPFLLGATWDVQLPLEQKWSVQESAKWDITLGGYEQSTVDKPDKGWFRKTEDYTIPSEWPDWVKRSFSEVGQQQLPDKWNNLLNWSESELPYNTKWVDGGATKDNAYIEINLGSFSYFTVFRIEPEGALDQDFRGHVKLYGLDEQKQYRIHAFDALGYIGSLTTAITDKYIRVYDESASDPQLEGVYSRTHALFAVEDPNGSIWVATQDPLLSGVSYYFPNLTAYDQSGKRKWSYRPLMGYNIPDEWESGLILNRSDGSVIYATGRIPYTKPGYYYDGLGNIYTGYRLSNPSTGNIAKIAFSGATVWQNDTIGGSYKIIPNTGTSGYVFTGNFWQSGDQTWYGVVGQTDLNGVTATWGSGDVYVTANFGGQDIRFWSIVQNNEGHYIVAGQFPRWSANRATGGTPTSDGNCAANPITNAFDGNIATFADWKKCCAAPGEINAHWFQYDFGVGNAYAIEYITDLWAFTADQFFTVFKIEGSNDSIAWSTIVDQTVSLSNATWPDTYLENKAKYRFYKINFSIDCGNVHTDCAGGSCAQGGDQWWGEEWSAYEIEMYESEPYATLTKVYGLSGVSEGTVLSSVSFPAGRSFYDVCVNRDNTVIAAVGYSSGNSVYVITVDNNLNTIRERSLQIGSEGKSIRPTMDNGYVICGTRYLSGNTEMFVSKLGKDLDPEWTKYFKEPDSHGAVGRYAIETQDRGFLAVGGSYPTATSSKVYIVKMNRHGESCSPGKPCD